MAKRPTSQNVADMAGVSKWTVIRAFTPGASITEESRAKVMAAAGQLNYRPNLLARSLATNLTHQVAILVDDFENPHKLPVLERLTLELQAEGLVPMLVNINERFGHVHALLNAGQRQVDAVILFGTAFRNETLQDARLEGAAPMFVLARDSQIPGVPAISCDATIAIEELCAHLREQGYRRPGFMAGPQTLSTALGRRRSFKTFWVRHGVEHVPELPAKSYSMTSGAEAVRHYLQETSAGDRIDVLMCENDALALGALDVLRSEFGLRVPQDIAVAGFDNIMFADAPAYDLTTYEQPIEDMVKTTIDMILGRRERQTVQLRGRLVVRGSTKRT
ncbi:LacI family transcriptional regulator [Pararhizobium polonicum]|uniref:LacI family transcriptional regulator n=1 Tax=Pararhizobium polonicum TaxID=1612624 RepID=A0A1C7P2X3_9HYPH|nr:LacI family DNA-binding transcriptional regulator [Pararhizobium polonicum]OBZ95598.1 LacI family transcriptional regulator [Pararhizobium polonicum]